MTKKVLAEEHSNLLVSFTQGLDVDKLMYREEIFIQMAWVEQLSEDGHFSAEEKELFLNAFTQIKCEVENGLFQWNIYDEDIHMNIERALTEKVGEIGKKIHLGRSRNDLVATTQRLFVANKVKEIDVLIRKTILAINSFANENLDVIIPGLTHQQSGQPIRFSHAILSYAHAMKRDLDKMSYVRKLCLESLPLGAAAFSGTHLEINLEELASRLGFQSACFNSYDVVGDRDFILEALNSFSILATHILRLCNEIIFNASTAVQLYKLPKNWTTGSSIMPNKRNPDTLEITRAKMHRVVSISKEACSIVGSVIPSYGSDLHELKRSFMLSYQEIYCCLEILNPFIEELQIDSSVAEHLLEKGHILATEYANFITEQTNGNFRQSYIQTKKIVEKAEKQKLQIHQLDEWPKHLNFNSSVEARKCSGGTSLKSIKKQIEFFQKL